MAQKNNPPASLNSSTSSQHYLILQGQKVGPLNKSEIISLIDQGEIFFNDLILNKEKKEWIKIFETKEFSPHFSSHSLPKAPFAQETTQDGLDELPPPLTNILPSHNADDLNNPAPEDLLASLAFVKHAEIDPDLSHRPQAEQTGPFHNISQILGLGELENTPSDGESGTHWFLSTWQDWLIDHKSILSLLTISFFIVFGLIQWLRSPDKVQNFTKSEENLKANRLPATKEETSYKKPEKLKASDRVNPQAHKEYAPNRELPIERTHEDENGTTIIRYVPDTKKIDHALYRGNTPESKARKIFGVGESAQTPPEASERLNNEDNTFQTTEYENRRIEIEEAREAQERELELLKEQELRRQEDAAGYDGYDESGGGTGGNQGATGADPESDAMAPEV